MYTPYGTNANSRGWGYGGAFKARKLPIYVQIGSANPCQPSCDAHTLATDEESCPNFVQLTTQDQVKRWNVVCCKLLICMEALTAVTVALLTIYDMCKAVDRGMTISDVRLLEKHGGKSGSFVSP